MIYRSLLQDVEIPDLPSHGGEDVVTQGDESCGVRLAAALRARGGRDGADAGVGWVTGRGEDAGPNGDP